MVRKRLGQIVAESERRLSRSATTCINWRSERRSSKNRISCRLKKTTGSMEGRPVSA